MRITLPAPAPPDAGFGRSEALPSLGAAQRACLGRGLGVVLILTLAGVTLVYAPLIGREGGRPAVGAVIRLTR